jgi:hypothetical protein
MTDRFAPRFTPPTLDPEDIFRPNLAAEIDDTRTWVDPNGYQLSHRLWKAGKLDRKQIESTLRAGLAAGASPLETAKAVEGLLNPSYQLRRDPDTFRPLPMSRQPKGVATLTPRQGPGQGVFRPRNSGIGNYAARRLARTETTRAFGAATLKAAQANPFVERVKWLLSRNHPEPDECDQNAERSSRNQPRGVYLLNEVPQFPNHPHEMCTIGPYVTREDIDDAIPRIREYIRTGEMPPRGFVETGGTLLPDAAPVPSKRPAWVRKIDAMRAEFDAMTGYGDAERGDTLARKAGKILREQMVKSMSPTDRARLTALANAKKDLAAKEKRANTLAKKMITQKAEPTLAQLEEMDIARGELVRARIAEQRARRAAMRASEDVATGNPYHKAMQDTLPKVRPMGSDRLHPFDDTSSEGAKRAVNSVRHAVPTDWWDDSIDFGVLHTNTTPRAYYASTQRGDPTDLMVSGDANYQVKVAVHEFGHRVENIRPRTSIAERGCYDRRTKGEALEHMGPGYGKQEVTRKDDFGHPYIGKDYGGSKHFEILSMGAEDLMRVDGKMPEILMGDDDMFDFIVGLFAIG